MNDFLRIGDHSHCRQRIDPFYIHSFGWPIDINSQQMKAIQNRLDVFGLHFLGQHFARPAPRRFVLNQNWFGRVDACIRQRFFPVVAPSFISAQCVGVRKNRNEQCQGKQRREKQCCAAGASVQFFIRLHRSSPCFRVLLATNNCRIRSGGCFRDRGIPSNCRLPATAF